jgi:hypothetical protein
MAHHNIPAGPPRGSTGFGSTIQTRGERKAMSVIMTLQTSGDPKALEDYAKDHPDKMRSILEAAKRHGLIAHRFHGSDDGGHLLVVDEWPDRQSFEAFFQEQRPDLGPMFEAAKVTGEPTAMFWQQLSTGDAYGWGA